MVAFPVAAVRGFCRALLVLNVLYCLLAAAQEGLPGWHMFESVEPIDHELRDRDGQVIDVRAVLPKNANLVDRTELRSIVAWICEHEPARAPFTYREQPRRHEQAPLVVQLEPIGRDGCKIHAPH